jgi:glycerol-3-phosphate dehydrogenase
VDHGRDGGPKGLWSVSGVKYTTARRVAEHTLRRVFERSGRDLSIRPESGRPPVSTSLDLSDPSALATEDRDRIRVALERLVEDECVLCMEDLLLRRTDWGTDPEAVPEVAIVVRDLLGSKLPDRVVPDDAAAGADI